MGKQDKQDTEVKSSFDDAVEKRVSYKDIPKSTQAEIPDLPGHETGLLGVKAPFGYRQGGDIYDRMLAAGKIKLPPATLKRD